jgi:DNA polymerase-4
MTGFAEHQSESGGSQTILHLDLDAFFCSVEESFEPTLRGKAFAVGGMPHERGVVSSCSYAARAKGVRSAMPTAQALRLCPGLILVSGRHSTYGKVSEQVMARLRELTFAMEQISIDEAFIDLSDVAGTPESIARRLQAKIRDELELPCSIGIASNKLVAKIATEVGKKAARGNGPPCGLTIVPVGEEAAFLAPLPVEMLWGVGPKTAAKLTSVGMHTIGDIAKWPESGLVHLFGENGRDLARRARGDGDRMIVTEREAKSISQETTFIRDVRNDQQLRKTLRELSDEVGRSLRKAGLGGATIKLKIRWPDFTTLTRQLTLTSRTDQDDDIFKTAVDLMNNVRKPGQAVRLIGVGVSGLGAPVRQLELWDTETDKARRLGRAIDILREKYGEEVIQRGEAADGSPG